MLCILNLLRSGANYAADEHCIIIKNKWSISEWNKLKLEISVGVFFLFYKESY